MMKKLIFLTLSVILMCSAVAAQTDKGDDLAQKQAAVKQAALDYVEGWYSGNPERMARALHPALHKVGIQKFSPNGNKVLTPIGYTAMVELARIGVGKDTPPEKANIQVQVFDIHGDMASVKVISTKFTDYLLLCELDGQWKIINVLWNPSIK